MHFCMDEFRMLENFVRSIAHIGALLPQIVAVLFWIGGKVWSRLS